MTSTSADWCGAPSRKLGLHMPPSASLDGTPAATTRRAFAFEISDEEPHTKALGYYLDRYPSGLVLNFQFTNWSRDCMEKRDFCIYAVAAHEFGHVLGFTHEQPK